MSYNNCELPSLRSLGFAIPLLSRPYNLGGILKTFSLSMLFCALSLLAAQAKADPVVSYTSSQISFAGVDATFGYSFTISAPVTIDALDYYSASSTGSTVILYDASATLASATVYASDPTESNGVTDYNVATITPVTLLPGQVYYVAADVPAYDTIVPLDAIDITAEAPVTYGASVAQPGYGNPTTDEAGNPDSYFTANFDIASAPEPSSFALFGTGGLGLFGVVRRRYGA
jgi:hypothetical protein